MKILNKFIWSKTEPKNKNDIWFDGSVFNLYRNDTWEAFTLPVDAAEKVAEVIKNVSEVYQEKLNAGYGIIIEGNTISVDPNLKNYDDTQVWESIDFLQDNKANKRELNNYVPTERFTSTIQTLSDSLGEIAAIKADKTEVNKELNKKLNKADVATINGKSITEGGNITIESSGPYDDTEIRQELTELSAEVSGLSEKIENLPSAESSVFKAEYGVTTYEEIKAAYDSGKVVHCDFNNNCHTLVRINDVEVYLNAVQGLYSYYMYCRKKDNAWVSSYNLLEQTPNKVTSLSESSTDTQYPSAKAVYDFVNNTLGVIINGDY